MIEPPMHEDENSLLLPAITLRVDEIFAGRWRPLHAARAFKNSECNDYKYPGVYVLAYTHESIEGEKITPKFVHYVGMTNSAKGVRGRLNQFKFALEHGKKHSAGNYFYRYVSRGPFSESPTQCKFYFSARTTACNAIKKDMGWQDLVKMGHVACLEYYVISHIKQKTDHMPKFNFRAKSQE